MKDLSGPEPGFGAQESFATLRMTATTFPVPTPHSPLPLPTPCQLPAPTLIANVTTAPPGSRTEISSIP